MQQIRESDQDSDVNDWAAEPGMNSILQAHVATTESTTVDKIGILISEFET